MENRNNRPPMSRRQQRLYHKYMGQLRCEACNRRTQVPVGFYKKIIEDHGTDYTFYCKRERCIKSRPEGLVKPHRKDKN